jgi:2-C-methyl-D-erythritol 4-phosphate cytidylyltransferase
LRGQEFRAPPFIHTNTHEHNDRVLRTFERTRLRRALTPQCFRYELLRRAFEQSPELVASATDDSSLVESLGATVTIIEGDARNIKLTRPEDMALGEMLLKQESESRIQNPE